MVYNFFDKMCATHKGKGINSNAVSSNHQLIAQGNY